jgi:hypothetical protein
MGLLVVGVEQVEHQLETEFGASRNAFEDARICGAGEPVNGDFGLDLGERHIEVAHPLDVGGVGQEGVAHQDSARAAVWLAVLEFAFDIGRHAEHQADRACTAIAGAAGKRAVDLEPGASFARAADLLQQAAHFALE